MIEGRVNARLEATIVFDVKGPRGRSRLIEAVIDTGYSEFLTLPPAHVSDLGLPHKARSKVVLANGAEEVFDFYDAELVWDGQLVAVAVGAAEVTPLVGMSLLEGHELRIEARNDGRVLIESLPA
ncbi:clan AA aspartic protease [Candidatus Poriferisodalis sp.]|uniref:clan AA aspartic protease n=1 Tax=Candidatus Poriferisodalis sp. TaxID=3101277 RepID=UPI003B51CA82